jgi:hypothetical protein
LLKKRVNTTSHILSYFFTLTILNATKMYGFSNVLSAERLIAIFFIFLAKHLATHGCRSAYSDAETAQKAVRLVSSLV